MKFSGITNDTLYLLAENRFQNSKPFYEAHKKQINEGAVYQMRALVEDLSPMLMGINPGFILDPVRCVCRVRRDTRFKADKTLYRSNLWFMIRHQKNYLPTPGFWFEFTPTDISWGVGVLSTPPSFMEFFRREIVKNPAAWEAATQLIQDCDMPIVGEQYKKNKAEADGVTGTFLPIWYNCKELITLHEENGTSLLEHPRKLERLLEHDFTAAGELYRLFLDVTQRFNTSIEGSV